METDRTLYGLNSTVTPARCERHDIHEAETGGMAKA